MRPGTQILDLCIATASDVEHALGPDPGALLAGSGVSIWEPTNLPSGQEFTLGMYDALFHSHGRTLAPGADDDAWLRAWFENGDSSVDLPAVPFEVLMERCPLPDPLLDLVCRLYASDAPNSVHGALAKLVAGDRVHSVVATNYDRGLDAALHTAIPIIARVVRECDIRGRAGRCYFKIHGSASATERDTIVHRLRYEGALPGWKRTLLHDIVHDRCLVVVGYSGIDFDVCPELSVAPPRSVVWNFRSRQDADRSPGLRRVEETGIPVTVVVGDMRVLLSHLGAPPKAVLARTTFDIASELRRSFSPDTLLLWRTRLLNSMGFARLATTAADALDDKESERAEVLRVQAQARFHAGLYMKSAELFRGAAEIASNAYLRRSCQLDASDAERCAGRLHAARLLVSAAVSGIPPKVAWASEIEGIADLKRILIERQAAIVSGRTVLPGGSQALTRKLLPAIRRGAPQALERGRWFDFQQLALWAQRLGLARLDLRPPDGYAPPDPKVGYRHLGYPVAVAMDACDRAREGAPDLAELAGLYRLMDRFGCSPQAWKLAYALVRADARVLSAHGGSFLRHFVRCEYTLPMRVAWLLRAT